MALTKFNESVSNVQTLPDNPTLTPAQLKALFDKAGIDIKAYINSTLTSEIDSKFSTLTEKINTMYPVGSIYMSVNNTNPSTLFGGTWEAWGAGKVPVGVDVGETEFNEVEKTGGAKSETLSVNQIPSHNHNFTGTAHGHTFTGTAHNHSFTGSTHNHGTSSSGQKFLVSKNNIAINGTKRAFTSSSSNGSYFVYTDDNDAGIVEDSKTANATQGGTIGSTTAGGTISNATAGGSISNTGSGQAHNNLQPYITCYMWKRTA